MVIFMEEKMEEIKIYHVREKRLFSRCKIEGFDYCINPYSGCPIGCRYCFASGRIKNFRKHGQDEWGRYLDIKYYRSRGVAELSGKHVVVGSVTDPYNPCEAEYHKTREILEDLPSDVFLTIWTKSDLILKDIFLLSRFPNLVVGVSICSLDAAFNTYMEPGAPSAERRLELLKKLHDSGIRTCLVISPIFPYITDVEALLDAAGDSIDSVRFENLKLRDSALKKRILDYVRTYYPQYYADYLEIYRISETPYWTTYGQRYVELCAARGLNLEFYINWLSDDEDEPQLIPATPQDHATTQTTPPPLPDCQCDDDDNDAWREIDAALMAAEPVQNRETPPTQGAEPTQDAEPTQESLQTEESVQPFETSLTEETHGLPACWSGVAAEAQVQEKARVSRSRTFSASRFQVKTIDEMTDEEFAEAAEDYECMQMMDWIKDDPWYGQGDPFVDPSY